MVADSPSVGLFLVIVTFGTICLLAGIASETARRQSRLWLWLIPFALSQALIIGAGALQRQLKEPVLDIVLLAFPGMQFVIAIYLVYLLKGARLLSVGLAIFSLIYAIYASYSVLMFKIFSGIDLLID